MHYTWQWSYTVYSLVALLGLFAIVGVVLLVRRSLSTRRRWHRSPESIATPYGYIPWDDVNTQRMVTLGLERARTREYYVKGRE